jgi:Carboxypeptidase regulatory-like domain
MSRDRRTRIGGSWRIISNMKAAFGSLLLLASAFAQPGATAKLGGRLVNALTGDPLQGTLRLRTASSIYRGPQYVASSDVQGNFMFDQLAPGSYVLSAERAGFLRANYGVRFLVNGEALSLKAGDTVAVRFALTPRAAISGRVLDDDGGPISGIEVVAWRWRWSEQAGRRMLQQVDRAVAAQDGNFRLQNLEAGSYYLSAESAPVSDAALTRLVRRRLPEGYATTFYPSALNISDAEPLAVTSGESRVVDLRLKRGGLRKVRGRIENNFSGLPLNVMTIQLASLESPAASRTAVLREDTFEFSGVAPGRYSVIAQEGTPAQRLVARKDILVTDKDVENLRMELHAGADIRCVIREDKPRSEVHEIVATTWLGAPHDPTVLLRSADNAVLRGAVATSELPGGALHLRNVMPGRYWVDLANLPAGSYVKWIRLDGVDITSAPVMVDRGDQGVLEVMVSDRTASLSGVVRNRRGEPVHISQVVLAPVAPELAGVSRLVKGTVTGPGGAFRFTGITPGDYQVLAFEDIPPGLAEDPEFRSKLGPSGTRVSLSPSAVQTVDVESIPAARLQTR